jgi:hypothetical protein
MVLELSVKVGFVETAASPVPVAIVVPFRDRVNVGAAPTASAARWSDEPAGTLIVVIVPALLTVSVAAAARLHVM